jgi:preprotein translocase subunit SecF
MKVQLHVIERRKTYLIATLCLLAVCLAALLIRGFNFGIDFKGGSVAQFELHTTFEIADVKAITDDFDKDAVITNGGDDATAVIINSAVDFTEQQKVDLFNRFKERYKLSDDDLLSFNRISPSIGRDLQRQAIVSSLVTVALILAFITIRFKFYFGLSAIVALIHDLIVVMGVYAAFQIPVNSSFIAAMLTILGYSINNTIIVFDRIRENIRTAPVSSYEGIVETAVDKVFTRSLNTTLTTLIAVLSIYVFGVDSVREFTLPMMVGFVAGLWSSVFVASPVWFLLSTRKRTGEQNPQLAATKVKK